MKSLEPFIIFKYIFLAISLAFGIMKVFGFYDNPNFSPLYMKIFGYTALGIVVFELLALIFTRKQG